MALTPLGRINFEHRWNNFLKDEGQKLFDALKKANENTPEYDSAMEAIIAGLQTDVEVDYPYASKLAFVQDKLAEQMVRRS